MSDKRPTSETRREDHRFGVSPPLSLGVEEELLLVDVPRTGDYIRTRNGPRAPLLLIESVTWVEGGPRPPFPQVIVGVREQPAGPAG